MGWVFVLGSSFSLKITLGFLMIQDGVWGRMLSCISFREILNSLRVDFIRKPKGFMDLLLFLKCCLYLGLTMPSWVGLNGKDFSFV